MTAMRSPTTPRSEVSSPRQKFDSEMLKGYMKKLFPATLQSSVWPPSKDRDQVKLWIKEIGERVKERMLGMQYCRFVVSPFTNNPHLQKYSRVASERSCACPVNDELSDFAEASTSC